MLTPEAELVARCRAGDQEAFRELVEQHHTRVYRTAYALVGNPHDAAEVEQLVFVKAWQALTGFRADCSISTWLTRLTLNAARDHLRRRRSQRVLQSLVQSTRSRRDNMLERVEEWDALQRALDRLSPVQRHIIALRYGVELSTREMADVLGCPEGTVKSRLHTALSQLRTQLDAQSRPKKRRFVRTPRRVLDP